ncbi:MAG: YbhB/YbcL family Raf kinase inhibitor-like protein [Candidatus Thiodiazotropha sp.]|nr:YbhB/YbcL family Raf kinase inhibitor-like protein [Candidatus Thiodiazotropha sp. (ex Lucina pensylvanica)]MBT3063644.1 YbhB/YbcL family Raf kinase inhibitor-like protein [Candidatus Thiodiazotropha sp. (ex Lucina pensylvanica)]
MPMTLISNAFPDGGGIPTEYTCQGADISPQLAWDGVPENTRSLVLIVDDPDAPDPMAPKMVWVHWVLFNLPPETRELPMAVSTADLPGATGEGINDWNRTGYGGPCPPIGRHRYFHKLYALDSLLEGLDNPTKAEVEQAMEGHVIAEAVLMGTYLKSS